jgi:predicted house-cleaning noncanonical NTP pyrophosphatase (MazG superfamily)
MLFLTEKEIAANRRKFSKLIGGKAEGLLEIPPKWRPPFIVVPITVYEEWRSSTPAAQTKLINKLAKAVQDEVQDWQSPWPRGLIIRSSALDEDINDRGAWRSEKLTADYGRNSLQRTIASIFNDFKPKSNDHSLALLVQPLAKENFAGHCSNERRVSKTVNQWKLEYWRPSYSTGRFNSQRASIPDRSADLAFGTAKELLELFRGIGRWCTGLGRGPVLIEFACSTDRLRLLQIDFEDEAHDAGVDPRKTIRKHDFTKSLQLPKESLLTRLDKRISKTGWGKLDNTSLLRKVHNTSFPDLYFITGDKLKAYGRKTKQLKAEINLVTCGRAVCRTDCNSKVIGSLNLPRTPTVAPQEAVSLMKSALRDLTKRGARPDEICFILHRFIPALSSAWARAEPNSQLVQIDSLWGVPDGLQYLAHDSFEFDVIRNKTSSSRLRYKPTFIQEAEDGSWEAIKVNRKKGRSTSLSESDRRKIALATHEIAKSTRKPTLVMWFCNIPDSSRVEQNLPWFRMPAHSREVTKGITPSQFDRVIVRNESDLDNIMRVANHKQLLCLDPDLDLYRQDEQFLLKVIEAAKGSGLPVEISGSALAHAHYQLEREGITVVSPDSQHHPRVRGRQVFQKLVRDEIPDRIREGGERTIVAHIAKPESRNALIIKLFEEALELKNASSPNDVVAELADLLEVVKSIAEATGADWHEVNETANKKKDKRGSFNKGVVLMETGWPKEDGQEETGIMRISLAELAGPVQTSRRKSEAHFSFAHLLAEEAEKTADIGGGFLLQAELTDNGILLRIVKRPDDNQLRLDLDQD